MREKYKHYNGTDNKTLYVKGDIIMTNAESLRVKRAEINYQLAIGAIKNIAKQEKIKRQMKENEALIRK